MGAIEVEKITKRFDGFTAVDAVSFVVESGEVFGLLGPNGAGKSTLIRMMTTLIPITAGVARIAGHDVRTDPDDARRVIGVIPQSMVDKELAHTGISKLHIVGTMHERKALMADLADGFAALPGAFGTADELFEILTWAQLGLHAKPVAILNIDGFFQALLAWLDHAVAEGFLKPKHRRLLQEAEDAEKLVNLLSSYRPEPAQGKWPERRDL